jgi:hypothetical protein
MTYEECLKKMGELSEQLTLARRDIPPAESEEALWAPVIDMDTNKMHWYPQTLYNEYQDCLSLRFSLGSSPAAEQTS